jgi:hypothetical protein
MPKQSKRSQPAAGAKKKTERKAPGTTAPAAKPLIDPAQSAAAAAAMVAHKVSTSTPATGTQTESSSFRNLKQSLNKPHSQTMDSVLDRIAPAKTKTAGFPLGGGKQVGHNQTYGPGITQRNVPRRTNG